MIQCADHILAKTLSDPLFPNPTVASTIEGNLNNDEDGHFTSFAIIQVLRTCRWLRFIAIPFPHSRLRPNLFSALIQLERPEALHLRCGRASEICGDGTDISLLTKFFDLNHRSLLHFTVTDRATGGETSIRLRPMVAGKTPVEVSVSHSGPYQIQALLLVGRLAERCSLSLTSVVFLRPRLGEHRPTSPARRGAIMDYIRRFGSDLTHLSVGCPSDEPDFLDSAITRCPKLEALVLADYARSGDTLASTNILRNLPPNLKTLCLDGCRNIRHDRLALALVTCPNLSSLSRLSAERMPWSAEQCELLRVRIFLSMIRTYVSNLHPLLLRMLVSTKGSLTRSLH